MCLGQIIASLLVHSRFCNQKISPDRLHGDGYRRCVVDVRRSGRIPPLQTICIQLEPGDSGWCLRQYGNRVSGCWCHQSLHGSTSVVSTSIYARKTASSPTQQACSRGYLWSWVSVSSTIRNAVGVCH